MNVTEKQVHEIVDDKLSMHINYPAPKGHKGLERVMRQGSHEGSDNYGGKGSRRKHGAHFMPHRQHSRDGR